MKTMMRGFLGFALGFALIGNAQAAEILVNSNIAASTTWTANNTYNLQTQVYVLSGATLTIEPGVVVASDTNVGGSLAVARGAKIFVNGTEQNPVIMTSKADVATWAVLASHPTGKNPKTGTWREGVNEWGNLTIMGNGFISASHFAGLPVGTNTKTPTGLNVKQMEGLVAGFVGDPKVIYGGSNDNDDSGAIHYLSLRYGGKVVGLGNELNGLSLGALGRETEIDHVDIMNNVDDGIEIWGGKVNLKYINIWNIGDDSLDIDQGWRGKAQFGLIVQGHAANASQGSGVGDNMIETDGAEDSDAQPVTTAALYNFTLIGQPVDGDQATAWRDNARIQHRNHVIMDTGEEVVRLDNVDGDGAQGYGFGGTLTWANTWTTAASESLNQATTLNGCDDIGGGCGQGGILNNPIDLYTSQVDGSLAEVKGTVFFRNQFASAYNQANTVGVTVAGNDNLAKDNVVVDSILDAAAPVKSLVRGAAVVRGGKTMLPVTSLDPRAQNEALITPATIAPEDGFFTAAPFHGAFSGQNNWLKNWTAAHAFGMTVSTSNAADPVGAIIKLTATTLFPTVAGTLYTVEESADGSNWVPVDTIVGNGSTMSVSDIKDFDNTKLYRAIAQ